MLIVTGAAAGSWGCTTSLPVFAAAFQSTLTILPFKAPFPADSGSAVLEFEKHENVDADGWMLGPLVHFAIFGG